MGIINDIVDIVVPKAQKRIEKDGLKIKEALLIEFEEIGLILRKESGEE